MMVQRLQLEGEHLKGVQVGLEFAGSNAGWEHCCAIDRVDGSGGARLLPPFSVGELQRRLLELM